MIRVLLIGCLGVATWLVAATQVPSHVRLPVEGVVVGAVVTQPFGCTDLDLEPYDPTCPTRHFHSGIDLAAPEGTAVYSATEGTARTGYDPMGAGNFVSARVSRCRQARSSDWSAPQVSQPDRTSIFRSTSMGCRSTRQASSALNNLGRRGRRPCLT
jgi:hypothetical protein